MAFPGTYHEVEELTLRQVLQTRNARAIARKAGLMRGVSSGAVARPRTVIDTTIDPSRVGGASGDGVTLAYQWLVDLSEATLMRPFSSSADANGALVFASVLGASGGATALDPGDYTQMFGDTEGLINVIVATAHSDIDFNVLNWYTIKEDYKRVLRLSLQSAPLASASPFRFTFQVL